MCFVSVWMPGFTLASTHCLQSTPAPCVNSHLSSRDGELKPGELTCFKLCRPVSFGAGTGIWVSWPLHPENSAPVLGHLCEVWGKDTPGCAWSQYYIIFLSLDIQCTSDSLVVSVVRYCTGPWGLDSCPRMFWESLGGLEGWGWNKALHFLVLLWSVAAATGCQLWWVSW